MELVIIGLLGGLITGISPCILPVLPVIFLTGGAQSARFASGADDGPAPASRWRPYLVIAGLITSFTLVTLLGSLLLGALGLAGRRSGALPRPLTTAALASAGVDALAPVVLALPKAALVVPAGRFPTFIVLGISGVRLARGAGAG